MGEQRRREGRSVGCRPQATVQSSLQSQEREESRLQVPSLWSKVLPELSAYNTAEPSIWGRDLRIKTEYRRVI